MLKRKLLRIKLSQEIVSPSKQLYKNRTQIQKNFILQTEISKNKKNYRRVANKVTTMTFTMSLIYRDIFYLLC
jgi:hypothetical protein